MSTRAKHEGHDWIQGDINQYKSEVQSRWFISIEPGRRAEYNLGVWIRFNEFNRLQYYHINCLRRSLWDMTSPWRKADLKRVYRLIIERAAMCDKPRLP